MSVSLKELLHETAERLRAVEFPQFDAAEIIKNVFQCSSADLLMGKTITPSRQQLTRLEAMVCDRLAGQPLQYLLGEWDFYRRKFLVGPGVLIPRADTEVLIEAALPFLRQSPQKQVLDLCSGSGCIAITLALEEPEAQVTAVELSKEAFGYLTQNNALYGNRVRLILGDALQQDTVEGSFSLIVSNPPYLSDEDMASLQKEVSFEPKMALYGKEDGLFFYRELTRLYTSRLAAGGMLAYEIGEGQEDALKQILKQNGLDSVRCYKDYGGISRVVTAIKKGNR